MSAPKCAACGGDRPMRNLYSFTKREQAISEWVCATSDCTVSANGVFRIVARHGKENEGGLTV
jgi:hypothetical protein